VSGETEVYRLLERALETATMHTYRHGSYAEWKSQSGAQLWIRLNKKSEVVGLNPHFAGSSRIPIRIVETIDRTERSNCVGSFKAWANPGSDESAGDGDYPFIFDVPDFLLYPSLALPGLAEVQVAAFAQDLSLYDSVESYEAGQEGDVRFASESFIPTGMFNLDKPDETSPAAQAGIIGRVLAASERVNEQTGASFHWISVSTYGEAIFDIVADPEFVPVPPVVGGVVSGNFWLSGRLTKQPPAKRSIRRLFGKN
jgi:hypothetical protein